MHYIFLKNILETVLLNFTCPQCQSKTNEQSIQISWVSSHGVDIFIHCHVCGANSQLNAEINSIAAQMLQNENGKKYFEEFLKQGGTIAAAMNNSQNIENSSVGIKEEDISKIHDEIKKAKSIEDIMGKSE